LVSYCQVYAKAGTGEVTPAVVQDAFKRVLPKENINEVFGPDSAYDYGRQLAKDFVSRTGLEKLPQALLNGVPIQSKYLNADGFEEGVMMMLSQQMTALQQAVYDGSLVDSDDVLDYLMRQPNVMPR
jgi:UDP-glucose:glycoprotein glucosyltransferase